jgi:hypothetical protein
MHGIGVGIDLQSNRKKTSTAPPSKEESAGKRCVVHGTYRKLNVMRLQDNYNNIEEFARYDESYGLLDRFCEWDTTSSKDVAIAELWDKNPYYTLDIVHGNKITVVKKNKTGRWVKA